MPVDSLVELRLLQLFCLISVIVVCFTFNDNNDINDVAIDCSAILYNKHDYYTIMFWRTSPWPRESSSTTPWHRGLSSLALALSLALSILTVKILILTLASPNCCHYYSPEAMHRFGRVLDLVIYPMGPKNGLHAADYNSAESEPICMNFGNL